jgi:hypothetical protein
MAWITTDTDIAKVLTVDKIVNGQHLQGYPKTYSILTGFLTYPTITVNDWHKMNESQRNDRIVGFKTCVESIEGISIDDTQTNNIMQPSSEQEGEVMEI